MNAYNNPLSSRSHCRHCVDRRDLTRNRPKGLRRANPRHPERVLEAVERLLDAALAQGQVFVGWYVTKEALAARLRIPEHFVARAFQQLNQRGRLSRGSNTAPHDSTRDIWGGHDSAWAPTRYRVLR